MSGRTPQTSEEMEGGGLHRQSPRGCFGEVQSSAPPCTPPPLPRLPSRRVGGGRGRIAIPRGKSVCEPFPSRPFPRRVPPPAAGPARSSPFPSPSLPFPFPSPSPSAPQRCLPGRVVPRPRTAAGPSQGPVPLRAPPRSAPRCRSRSPLRAPVPLRAPAPLRAPQTPRPAPPVAPLPLPALPVAPGPVPRGGGEGGEERPVVGGCCSAPV